MTEILKERDDRGGYIVPMPIKWWKFIFDAQSKTWTKYGALAFVEGRTETEARTAAMLAEPRPIPEIITSMEEQIAIMRTMVNAGATLPAEPQSESAPQSSSSTVVTKGPNA